MDMEEWIWGGIKRVIKKIKYKEYKIKTAGVLQEGDWDTDWGGIYAPLETVEKMIKDKQKT